MAALIFLVSFRFCLILVFCEEVFPLAMIIQKWTKRMQNKQAYTRSRARTHTQQEWSKQKQRFIFNIIRYLRSSLENHEFSIDAPMFISQIEKCKRTTSNYLARKRMSERASERESLFDIPCCFAFSNDLIFVFFMLTSTHNNSKHAMD